MYSDNLSTGVVLIVVILAIWVIVGLAIGGAAARKNRSKQTFFWLTLLLSPILTGLIIATLPFDDADPRSPKNKAIARSGTGI